MGNIAVITARSGSKGLKDKNIKMLCGKPLIAYSIEAALKSGCFECVHVSTDSEEYARIAMEYEAEVPFLRSQELSTDTSSTWDVLRNVLKQYRQIGKNFERMMLLQPTSPLRDETDIRQAFSIMEEKQAKSVVAVCEMEHSPLWSNVLPENGNMNGFMNKSNNVLRQQLPIYYRVNGAVYLVDAEYFMGGGELYGPESYAYIMPKEKSVDIDDNFDFLLVQTYMQKKMKERL